MPNLRRILPKIPCNSIETIRAWQTNRPMACSWHLGMDDNRACNITHRQDYKRTGQRKPMADTNGSGLTRRSLLGAFAATALAAAPTYSNAAGFLRGGGDIRRLRMYSGRTGERLDMIYWIDGDYIKDAVKEINYFMRDWRTDQIKPIDLRTLDIMAASHNLLDVHEPYMMLSGYRSRRPTPCCAAARAGWPRTHCT